MGRNRKNETQLTTQEIGRGSDSDNDDDDDVRNVCCDVGDGTTKRERGGGGGGDQDKARRGATRRKHTRKIQSVDESCKAKTGDSGSGGEGRETFPKCYTDTTRDESGASANEDVHDESNVKSKSGCGRSGVARGDDDGKRNVRRDDTKHTNNTDGDGGGSGDDDFDDDVLTKRNSDRQDGQSSRANADRSATITVALNRYNLIEGVFYDMQGHECAISESFLKSVSADIGSERKTRASPKHLLLLGIDRTVHGAVPAAGRMALNRSLARNPAQRLTEYSETGAMVGTAFVDAKDRDCTLEPNLATGVMIGLSGVDGVCMHLSPSRVAALLTVLRTYVKHGNLERALTPRDTDETVVNAARPTAHATSDTSVPGTLVTLAFPEPPLSSISTRVRLWLSRMRCSATRCLSSESPDPAPPLS
jgi:hypothetical protein